MQRRDLLKFLITFPNKIENLLYLVSKLCIIFATFFLNLFYDWIISSHFFIVKNPPSKMWETINFTSEVEATISSQESQPPPIQRQVDQSTASEAVEINITEPFQPADFNFPKKHCGKQDRAFQSKWFSEFLWLHYNEQSDSVLCFICMQQNAKWNFRAARSKEVCFVSKGFSNWKKALARFKEHQVCECHKIAIDYETNLSRTCRNVWEMSGDAAKKTMAGV